MQRGRSVYLRRQPFIRSYHYYTLLHHTHGASLSLAMFSTIVGFSLFGLAARVGQLGIQKRNLFDSESRKSRRVQESD